MSGPLVLAIESATSVVGCAVGTDAGVLASTWSARGRRHAESLAPQIRFVLDQAGVSLHDLDRVAVDVGPGLYTGLRVGITTARTLAHTLDVSMIGVTSLDALARAASAGTAVGVAIDARRGEVFHAIATANADGTVTGTTPAVGSPEEVATALVAEGVASVVGDGARAYAPVFSAHGLQVGGADTAMPDPAVVLRLALARVGDAVAPAAIEPMYLRRPDAVAKWAAS